MPIPITLKVFRGNELVRTEQFNREIIKIGRLSSAHLVLDDERVSRIHAVIEVAPDGAVSIIDMGSAEGTFVNGKKVSRGPLKPGDQVALGGLRLQMEDTAKAAGELPVAEAPAAAVAPAARPAPQPAAPRAPSPSPVPAQARPAPPMGPTPSGRNGPARGGMAVPAVAKAPSAQAPEPVLHKARAQGSRLPARRRAMRLKPADRQAEDLSGTEDLGVELRLLWGETLLDAATFVRPRSPVLVGKSSRCALQVEGLPQGDFPMLRFAEGDYQFSFGQGMTGVLEEKGARVPFGELVRTRRAANDEKERGSYWIPVPRAGAVRADLGSHLAVEARPRGPQRVKKRPFWERINYQFLNLFLIFLFLQSAFIITANNFPYDTDVSADDLFKNPSRMAKFIIKAPEVQKPKLAEKGPKNDEKKGDPGEAGEKHKGEEGQMGKKDAPKTNGRSAPRAIDPNAKDMVKRSGLLGALGRGGGGLSTVFGSGGLGGDLKGAVGNMFGPVVGDSYGMGGLGIRGTGSGGGGSGETIGIGAVGTKGRGGGMGGGAGYGTGVGGLGKKSDRDVKVDTGNATVMGSIDKELIRKVIQDHAAQIRYCYEQQLAINPRLQGKVSIKWIIQADGSATNPQVDESATTLDDGKVHECMMSRITSWQFPKPKGGGIAVITYPWILRASGNSE